MRVAMPNELTVTLDSLANRAAAITNELLDLHISLSRVPDVIPPVGSLLWRAFEHAGDLAAALARLRSIRPALALQLEAVKVTHIHLGCGGTVNGRVCGLCGSLLIGGAAAAEVR